MLVNSLIVIEAADTLASSDCPPVAQGVGGFRVFGFWILGGFGFDVDLLGFGARVCQISV